MLSLVLLHVVVYPLVLLAGELLLLVPMYLVAVGVNSTDGVHSAWAVPRCRPTLHDSIWRHGHRARPWGILDGWISRWGLVPLYPQHMAMCSPWRVHIYHWW